MSAAEVHASCNMGPTSAFLHILFVRDIHPSIQTRRMNPLAALAQVSLWIGIVVVLLPLAISQDGTDTCWTTYQDGTGLPTYSCTTGRDCLGGVRCLISAGQACRLSQDCIAPYLAGGGACLAGYCKAGSGGGSGSGKLCTLLPTSVTTQCLSRFARSAFRSHEGSGNRALGSQNICDITFWGTSI